MKLMLLEDAIEEVQISLDQAVQHAIDDYNLSVPVDVPRLNLRLGLMQRNVLRKCH
jgi:hypothetical protein